MKGNQDISNTVDDVYSFDFLVCCFLAGPSFFFTSFTEAFWQVVVQG